MKKMSTKKGKAKPRCFVCGSNMKAVIRTEIVCSKCGSKLQEADRDG
jgi:tRNA(Ile2) C34 agmatinyltransferase TiaS